MIVACSGMASPIRNSQLTPRRNQRRPSRMIAYAAMNDDEDGRHHRAERDDHAVDEVVR